MSRRTLTMIVTVLALLAITGGAFALASNDKADPHEPQQPALDPDTDTGGEPGDGVGDDTDDPGDAPDRPAEPAPAEPTTEAETASITYGTETPGTYMVWGLATGDSLNIRTGPGTHQRATGTFAATAIDVESTGRNAVVDGRRWIEVKVPGATTGWVSTRYLTEQTPEKLRERESPGRRLAYLSSVDKAHIVIDDVEMLDGQAAIDAARADGVELEDGTLPNDYYIRNRDLSTTRLPMATDVKTTMADGSAGIGPDAFAHLVAGKEYVLIWLTVTDGAVTEITEQYLP